MIKNLISFLLVTIGLNFYASAGFNSKAEQEAYFEGCKKAFSQARPDMNPDDVKMMCNDPYLRGTANESKADKARRLRLINQTNEDKTKMLESATGKTSYMSNCKKAILQQHPDQDPKDVQMLCENPYLTAVPGESSTDQERRKRLIKNSDDLKKEFIKDANEEASKSNKNDSSAGQTR